MAALILAVAALLASGEAEMPPDADLVAALRAWDNGEANRIVDAAERRGEIVLIHPRTAERVTQVECREREFFGDVVCGFDAFYYEQERPRKVMLLLEKRESRWFATQGLTLWP